MDEQLTAAHMRALHRLHARLYAQGSPAPGDDLTGGGAHEALVLDGPGPDPLLEALTTATAQREAADALTRLLIAYAREAAPRTYPLATLAEATGMSPSGLRSSYTAEHLALVRAALADLDTVQDRGAREKDDEQDAALASVTSIVQRMSEPIAPGEEGVAGGGFLSEEQLRERLREILRGQH